MSAMKGVTGPVSHPLLCSFSQQSSGGRVVLQERNVMIHNKHGHGHCVEKHPVKSLVQELYHEPTHNE